MAVAFFTTRSNVKLKERTTKYKPTARVSMIFRALLADGHAFAAGFDAFPELFARHNR